MARLLPACTPGKPITLRESRLLSFDRGKVERARALLQETFGPGEETSSLDTIVDYNPAMLEKSTAEQLASITRISWKGKRYVKPSGYLTSSNVTPQPCGCDQVPERSSDAPTKGPLNT